MNKLKTLFVFLISLLLLLQLAGCGGSGSTALAGSWGADSAEQPPAGDVQPSASQVPEENTPETETQPDTESEEQPQGPRVLIVFFSATNTTRGVAQKLADGLEADLYEILPEEPYTDADLDYHDNNSRTTIEMNDPATRPAISGSVENMEQYNIVFLGYPIWWSEAPRILCTFVESYDLSGKTIVPFCTSGGSGIGSSATHLAQLTEGAVWLEGRRMNGSDSQETVMEWVSSLDLFE